MNETAVIALIGAIVFALLAWPFLRSKKSAPAARQAPRRPDADRSDLPDELAELELDHAMGRLSDEDYEALRAGAALVATEAEAGAVGPAAPGPVPAPPVDVEDRAEAMISALAAGPVAVCPTCGDRPEPGARFCSSCGRQLDGCPVCGKQPPQAGAKFCSNCGSTLAA